MGGAINTVESWFGGDAMQKTNDSVGNDIKDSQAKTAASTPVTPTLANSQAALDEASDQQRKAKGAQGTIFSNQPSGLLGSGSASTSKMLLGS